MSDKSRYSPDAPLANAWTLPSLCYFDQTHFLQERERVFGPSWQLFCHLDQLKAVGDYVACAVLGEPIVAVRSEHGIQAFYNVCRHKAACVASLGTAKGEGEQAGGQVRQFRCPYHGWSYNLSGELCGASELEGIELFSKEDFSLVPVPLQCLGPWLFVSVDPDPMPFADVFGPFQKMSLARLGGLQWRERRQYELACNWKVFADNYLDGGYHVNHLHADLASAVDYREYGTTLYSHSSLQSSPLRSSNHESVRSGEAHYWWIYPNLMVNIYNGVMDTNIVIPTSPTTCRVIFDYSFSSDVDEARQRQSIALADKIQNEDQSICVDVQRGLQSRSYDSGRLAPQRESGIHHFHRLLSSVVGFNP